MEREEFVKALSKFTMLTTSVGLIGIRPKDIDAIKTLIAVAYSDGNYLQDSWEDVSSCLLQ